MFNSSSFLNNTNSPDDSNDSNDSKNRTGAGTGLGEAYLTHDGSQYVPHSSEGGHCDFPPRNQSEMELVAYLRHRIHSEREKKVRAHTHSLTLRCFMGAQRTGTNTHICTMCASRAGTTQVKSRRSSSSVSPWIEW